MYRPPAFAAEADEIAALIDEFALAQLIVATPDGLLATPVPLIRRGQSLVGHLARPNAVWQHEGQALAIFTGPQAYISTRLPTSGTNSSFWAVSVLNTFSVDI